MSYSNGAYPRFVRVEQGRVVAGVAAGLSAHLRIDVTWVRLALTLTSFLGGMGVLAYAALWMFSPVGTPQEPVIDRYRVGGAAHAFMIVGAFALWALSAGGAGWFFLVIALVALGAVLAWQAYDRDMRTTGSVVLLACGAVLVMGGVVVIALMGDRGGITGVIMAVLASVIGVGILVVPLILRLFRSLVQEREEKAVADQHAVIAAHLHDSVLQTLALIQKRADDAEEVARLARGQERELRAWLYDAPATPTSLFAALNTAAGEVEDMFNVRIRPVTVGEDLALEEHVEPIVLAAREAMVNAAKHSGTSAIDVYVEHIAGELSVFVRDRGTGFDVDAVPADRHGIRDSITGRMDSAGGTAAVKTAPGEGTEVVLTLPL
ncbi:ATP-binding protein [Corynebacterium meitnerae]|mgnify:CR=1 FL=1|uniref:PspC domain-containing protein n=1 Tax=Corynebacterium meitnerae TaxID=2913498 RepID=A0A9X3RIZ2_9CORY|nr:ATP-binding protein [Corynebacterium meitnerae]MCZ9293914.1 PspC domain-containing protein [Corynebacterium meitnerae]